MARIGGESDTPIGYTINFNQDQYGSPSTYIRLIDTDNMVAYDGPLDDFANNEVSYSNISRIIIEDPNYEGISLEDSQPFYITSMEDESAIQHIETEDQGEFHNNNYWLPTQTFEFTTNIYDLQIGIG